MTSRPLVLLAGLFFIGACTSTRAPAPVESPRTHENLHSVLWVQTAAEYRASALATYGSARHMLDSALTASEWDAVAEPDPGGAGQPPAVILDVDETVLDNAPYQARLIERETEFDRASWQDWVREEAAEPVPGAVAFTQYAAERGVTVFYVTNRRAAVEEATRANLARHGFPLDPDTDTVLLRGEAPHADTGDKTSRRAAVAEDYHVLQLIGDNLGDFVGDVDRPPAVRRDLVDEYSGYWGTRWFMLPNPQYGSWEGALFNYDYGRTRSEKLERKYDKLETLD